MNKKFLFLILIPLILILGMVLIPLIYKDSINEKIKSELENRVNGRFYYEEESFKVSFFRNFPNLNINLNQFGLIGAGVFEKDTLIQVGSMDLAFSPFDLILGNGNKIKRLVLERPKITALVFANGDRNWDLIKNENKVDQETTDPDNEEKPSPLQVSNLNIIDGSLVFFDQRNASFLRVPGLDIMAEIDGKENTTFLQGSFEARRLGLDKGEKSWVKEADISSLINLELNNESSSLSLDLKEGKINQMPFDLKGSISFGQIPVELHLEFNSRSTLAEFSSISPLAKLPGFETLETKGEFDLKGKISGKTGLGNTPNFSLSAKLENGKLSYPDLKEPLSDVNLDLDFKLDKGNTESSKFLIKAMEFKMGQSPFSLKGEVIGLNEPLVDLDYKMSLDLAEITEVFPLQSWDFKGKLTTQGKAKGRFGEKEWPEIMADLILNDAYINRNSNFTALENLDMRADLTIPSQNLDSAQLRIENFSFQRGSEKLEIEAWIKDLFNPRFLLDINGEFSLDLLSDLGLMSGQKVNGNVKADILLEGDYRDLKNNDPNGIRNSGNLKLSGIQVTNGDSQDSIEIKKADLVFRANQVSIKEMEISDGENDLQVEGTMTNYLGYLLFNNPLKGQLEINSNRIEIKQEDIQARPPASLAQSQQRNKIERVRNLDIETRITVKSLKLHGLDFQNLSSSLHLGKGVINCRELRANGFGGKLNLKGDFEKVNRQNTKFKGDLSFDNIDIASTYRALSELKEITPVLGQMEGQLSSRINFFGYLDEEGELITKTTKGEMELKVNNGILKNFDLVKKLMRVAKIPGMSGWVRPEYNLDPLTIQLELIDERIYFKPFEIVLAEHPYNFAGSIGLDKSADYLVATEFKPSQLGAFANAALFAITGGNFDSEQKMEIDFRVQGERDSPKVKLLGIRPKGAEKAENDFMEEARRNQKVEIQNGKIRQDRFIKNFENGLKKSQDSNLKSEDWEEAKAQLEELLKQIRSAHPSG